MEFIATLAAKLSKSEPEVVSFLASAPLKYKVYTIPKRTSGHRVIAQPSRELKEYQRTFLSIYKLKIHSAAMAYREGLSIKDNAQAHCKNRYLLKIDLKNFFNSISNELFWNVWQQHYTLPAKREKVLMERLLFWSPSKSSKGKLILSIGAPSSPLISNFFMYQFDELVTQQCETLNITYTRYADDLTFSTNEKDILFDIPKAVTEFLTLLFGNSMIINRRKTVFSSMAHNRHITGITINNKSELSLGRERKRYIKHLVHHYQTKQIDQETILQLKGLLAFSSHIEPDFIKRLEAKYSSAVISQIFEEQNG
ncbi:retron St85 family RNA-directed DNA polymerase [Rheinheimera maricola]|uniref:RNA-directed DNA polymerase n=1 Tax=Rheinheimera maricola TaxID=2793282 RepID=A0ABS7X9V8_9GAMM|nr:retron St85 family RNA-directed DNA polymerase [Rheinheimera maricola]MBZ9612341.1 retron St85 family RNA-directed DNA polymerase [Rheinheimera maricola]